MIEIAPVYKNFFELKFKFIPNIIPTITIVKIDIFIVRGRKKICVGIITHIKIAPRKIENITIASIDISIIFIFINMLSGLAFNTNFEINFISRIEYAAVIPRDIIIINDKKETIFELIIFSMIESFEKNPDMKGIPISVMFEIAIIVKRLGEEYFVKFIIRMSW